MCPCRSYAHGARLPASSLAARPQFEWSNPSSMYVTTMDENADGSFTRNSIKPVDWSAWGGLWIPCAGAAWGWRFVCVCVCLCVCVCVRTRACVWDAYD